MTMHTIALDSPSLSVKGALDVQRSADHIRVRRLPAWTQAQSPEPAFDLMVAMGSGVSLCFTTDADTIELDVLVTGLQFAGETRRPVVFDLLVAGSRHARVEVPEGHTIVVDGTAVRFEQGNHCTLAFNGLGNDIKQIAVFLPQSAMTEILALRIPMAAHVGPSYHGSLRWAHYGSSISHGMEAAGPSETWPAIAAQHIGAELTNLGFAGQCHLDSFVARTLRDGGFDAISMKLGANVVAGDTLRRRSFASAVHGFIDTIRDGNPAVPLLLISPIYSPLIDDAPGPLQRLPGGGYAGLVRPSAIEDGALTLASVRAIMKGLVAQRRAAGDHNLHYLDGTTLLAKSDTDMLPDHLHPDADGHRMIAQRFLAATGDDADTLRAFFRPANSSR